MISREEIKAWLLENCVDEEGNLNLSGLDFSDFDGNVITSKMKVKMCLIQCWQEAGRSIVQDGQKAKKHIYQSEHEVGGDLYQYDSKVKGDLINSSEDFKVLFAKLLKKPNFLK